ncbi:MAG: F0F1 ATP synthase subunit B family protein [Alphaproteobacteria bacterium]
MPQFEPTWFASQIFWLVIVFTALFFVLKSGVIPSVAAVLADRESRIQGDLELAARRRDELESMKAAYEADLAKARSEAQEAMREAQTRMAAKQAVALDVVTKELAARAAEAEQRIGAEKATALADLRSVAVEVAAAATGRLGSAGIDRARIEAAVDASMGA